MFTTNKNWVKAISEKDMNVNNRIVKIRKRLRAKREDVVNKLTTVLTVETAA